MSKSTERNLNVTIKNQEDNKDEVVISLSSIFRKLKKYFLPWIIIAAMLGVITLSVKTYSVVKSKPPLTALVSFNYSGIEKGLDPNGKTFDVNTLKNPEVISSAISELDMDVAKVESVRQNLSIAGVIPSDAIDRITAYRTIMNQSTNGSIAAAQAVLDTSYYPTHYKVTFNYASTGLSKSDAVQVLNMTLEKYRDYFYRQYGYNQSLGAAVTMIDYQSYDYPEAIDLFRSTLSTLATYLRDLSSEDLTRFRSSTGYTFEDLYESVNAVRTLDLDKADSLVTVNNITKDKQAAIDYYQFLIEDLTRTQHQNEESYKAVQAAKGAYQKDTLLVMQSADGSNTEISKTSEEYDKLVDQEVNLAKNIAATKQKINEYTTRKTALEKASSSTPAQIEELDKMLAGINAKVNDLVETTKDTADEYFKNVEFANAYSILVPAVNTNDVSLSAIVKNSVKSVILLEALIFFIYFGIAFVTAIVDENKGRKKLASATVSGGSDNEEDEEADDDEELDEMIEDVAEALGAEPEKKQSSPKNSSKKK